jgi:alkylation response protein AidB-like acyl-CoA dehydrogenase
MNFDFTETEKRLFDTIRTVAGAVPDEDHQGDASTEAAHGRLRDVLPRLAATGYLGLGLEKDAVGDAVTRLAAMEILAGQAPALFLAVEMSTRVLGRALAQWGGRSLPQTWLQGLVRGQWIGALALSEETLNVENDPLATRGDRQGDRIRLNGRKDYVINAPLADRIGVVGLLEGRTAIFMVDRQARGLTVSERIRTMGYNEAHIAGLVLQDCEVAAENVILPPEGTPILEWLRTWENEVLLAAALGLMQASFVEARDFAKSHRTGGKPIIAYQEVGFKLAEMLTLYQTAQLLGYRAAWAMAHTPQEGPPLLWCAKVFATEAAERVAGEALRILAGRGYRSGSASETAYRAVKWTQIGGISTEIARVRLGDQALGYR